MSTSPVAPELDLMDLSLFVEGREDEAFDALRRTDPVHWNPPSDHGPGFWSLLRYADVRDGASDASGLSSAAGTQIVDRKVEGHGPSSLHNMDDPEHAKLRKVTIPHLRAVKIEQWSEVIASSVDLLLDEAVEHGEFDMVDLIAARLPMLVLSQVMGVPAADAPRMVDWTNRLTSSDPDHKVDAAALQAAREDIMGYFEQLTEQRRREPTNDLVSILVNGRKDGEPLTWGELAAYYIVIVAAGNETTRHLVSGATVALDRTPGAWERLAADPAVLAPAVEEMFRYVTPLSAMRRTATRDLVVDGREISGGEKVVLWFAAANRDPDVFDAPHEFRVDRTPNDHLTFGWGIHFCLGAHLARAEVRAFYRAALDRGLRFEVTGEPERLPQNIFRGWRHIPTRVVSTR